MPAETLVHVGAVLMAAIAAIGDWRTGEIPNWLTLPAIFGAPLLYGIAVDPSWAIESITGLFLCGMVPYLMFRRNAIGGGDVKLFAAMGAVTGIQLGIQIELVAFVVGAVYALGRLAWEGKLLRTLGNSLYLGLNPLLPRKWRRQVTPELMSTVRMGGPILIATALSVAIKYPELWAGS